METKTCKISPPQNFSPQMLQQMFTWINVSWHGYFEVQFIELTQTEQGYVL